MPNTEEIIEKNNRATDYVVGTAGPIDHNTAELILRNTAVVADRLTPKQFEALGESATNALLGAVESAKEIVPPKDEVSPRYQNETLEEHRYRVEVIEPLHRLQSTISLGEFDPQDPNVAQAVKKAVWLGSTAFEQVVTDPAASQFGEIQTTMGYFDGNATAAAGRADRRSS